MAIVDTRTVFSKGQPSPQILVQWFGLPLEEATWENVIDVQQAYPDFNLEDKVGLQGGRNDTGLVKEQPQRKLDKEQQSQRNRADRIKRGPTRLKDYYWGM
ncbi:Chromo domain-containing protein [Cephalotus follicularis]|uniref:Chromo domain-containing protein n=1 Tax=Cephalotus follicularis TaxID=3775 RepID=A0A1Q3CT11_CEPFO|nr:Chromo domain-containing protein [Cephalotus follicularis]